MKNKINFVFTLILLLIPAHLLAIDYVYIDDHGIRYYRCDAMGAGGTAAVKYAGKGKYRITSGFKTGMVRADSLILAARIACGEIKEERMPVETRNNQTE